VSAPPLAYGIAAAAYLGFQLTVRLVVYPQFAQVPGEASARFERAHRRSITPLVAVLFGALALSVTAMLVLGPRQAGIAAAALFAGVLAVTGFGAVPQHATLSQGFDARAYRRLLRWDTVRVVLALAQVVLGVLLLAA
jgi:hypothetical protein